MINPGNSKDVDWDDVKIRYCNFESLSNIAKDYFITGSCVARKAKINAWEKNVELLKNLVDSNKTIDQIVEELKSTHHLIKSLIKTHGFKIEVLTPKQIRARRTININELEQKIIENKTPPELKMMLMLLG